LTVPEVRSTAYGNVPAQRTLRLYVTRIKSQSADPHPDPVLILNGGPGGASRGWLTAARMPLLQQAFLAQREVILLDQRGTGFSEPQLFAPEVDRLSTADTLLGALDADVRAQRYVDAALQARDRFVANGANLAAVNTLEIAADVNDLRLALGYDTLNLYGISYGTRPALVMMRDFPGALRSVILDSTVPVQVSQYVEAIPNAQRTFDRLFAAVAVQPAASLAYPNLSETFYTTIDRLNQSPIALPVKHPMTGEDIQLRLTGELFLGFCCLGFYDGEAIQQMPYRINQIAQGDYQHLAAELLAMLAEPTSDLPGWSLGMYYSVNSCDDKVTAQTAAEIEHYAAQYPALRSLPLTEFHLGKHIATIGERWGARPAGATEHAPVVSDIPTLILAGEFDQNTPSYWGKLAGETLSNSVYIEVPGAGHGVIGESDCGPRLISAFLENPLRRPDTGCLDKMSQWQFALPTGDR
jgi:pimeloyl-ACP methyl ester carboxylesterase